MKKVSLFAAASLLLATAAPAFAGTTGNVVVQWNIQAAATLTLHTNYNSAGAFGGASASIIANPNAGTIGNCAGTTNTTAATVTGQADGTDNYGTITPDTTNVLDCLYENAVNANVVTTSANWSLTAKVSAGTVPAGYFLCAVPNGTVSFATAPAGNLAVAQSSHTGTVPSVTTAATCGSAGGVNLTTTAANLVNADTNPTVAAGTNIGMDYELAVPANAASGAGTATVTYTLIAS